MNNVMILGDTHLGRSFVNNVPLHRRGDREKMVWDDFLIKIEPNGQGFHVHMGDLFDKPVVGLGLILRTARAYIDTAEVFDDTVFIILQGNHDKSRDLQAVSAFDIFKALVSSQKNIVVVDEPTVIDNMAFLPWDPLRNAEEQLARLGQDEVFDVAFGHWDIDARSDTFNLIPTRSLAARGVKTAYSGHDHLRRSLSRDGVQVEVVGSMQPYAHGEDADDAMYVTLSLDEAREQADDLKDCCVRIDLEAGEIFDLTIDCLQLQVRRPEEVGTEIDVSLGEFNLNTVFEEVLSEFEIPEAIAVQLRAKCQTLFTAQA